MEMQTKIGAAMQRLIEFAESKGLRWADAFALEFDGKTWTVGTKHNDYYDGWQWWDSEEAPTLPEAIDAYLAAEAKRESS